MKLMKYQEWRFIIIYVTLRIKTIVELLFNCFLEVSQYSNYLLFQYLKYFSCRLLKPLTWTV
jgi:hypothetical protein